MTTPRQTLLHRAKIATAGLAIAAGSATGLLTIAAAHASTGTVATSTTGDSSGTSTGSGSTGQSSSSGNKSGNKSGNSSSNSSGNSSGGSVASSHSS